MTHSFTDLELRISRVQSTKSADYIRLAVLDGQSRLQVVELEMSLAQLSQGLTGILVDHLSGETALVDWRLGKVRVTTQEQVEVPDLGYDKSLYVQWFNHNIFSGDGVEVRINPNTQSFITRKGDKTFLSYYTVSYRDP